MTQDAQTNAGDSGVQPRDGEDPESQLLDVLNDFEVEHVGAEVERIRDYVLSDLVRAIKTPTGFDPVMTMEKLRGCRLSAASVIDVYIPAAARKVGVEWVDDEISFATVTIAALRLRSLLDAASRDAAPEIVPGAERLRALVVVPRGEQHFLGASVLGTQLRRMGLHVATSVDQPLGALRKLVASVAPHMVMITCAQAANLDSVAETVETIRGVGKNGPLVALGGALEVDPMEIKDRTTVDIITRDVREAVAFCTRHVTALSPP